MRREHRSFRSLSTEILLVFTVCLSGLTGSCGFLVSPCGDPDPNRVGSGTYAGNVSYADVVEPAELPHENLEEMTITVDKEQDEVVVEYQKDGEAVVETWRIANSET